MQFTITDGDVIMWGIVFVTGFALGIGHGNLFAGLDRILFRPAEEDKQDSEAEEEPEEDPEEDSETAAEPEEDSDVEAEKVEEEEEDEKEEQVRRRWLWII